MSELQPHQQRVVKEQADNETRLVALAAFLGTELFLTLPEEDQNLLKRQHLVMAELNEILKARIQRF